MWSSSFLGEVVSFLGEVVFVFGFQDAFIVFVGVVLVLVIVVICVSTLSYLSTSQRTAGSGCSTTTRSPASAF